MKADIACTLRSSRKVRDDIRERQATVSRNFLRNTCRQDISFQEIPCKILRKSRDSFAIVATKENASSIGHGPCLVVSMILDIMKNV